ncbi:hypothetical protein H1Q63_34055 [Desmonostoc muscorum CCALA 125]|nr:hypothetical protein [Desmonostoc muscorum CCALA 125]
MVEQSLHLLLGKLLALLTVEEAQEQGCHYQQTKLWKRYEKHRTSFSEEITYQFIIYQAEKLIFKKQDKQVSEVLKKIAMIIAENGIPKHFRITNIEFVMGFWSALPEDSTHSNSEDDDYFEDDATQFQRVIEKYPSAIPASAMDEVPDCYLSLVDDGQYC